MVLGNRFALLLVVALGVLSPTAGMAAQTSAPPASADAIGRWVTNHRFDPATAQTPVSDVVNSLRVAAAGRTPTPISDNASSLGLHRSISGSPAPLATASSAHFAWTDAGFGAAATCLLMLMVAASIGLLRRHREATA
jgi:hypothetical protein